MGKDDLPWVVNDSGHIFRRLPWGVWEQLPGLASDIGVGRFNNAYVTGLDGAVHTFNEQPQATYDTSFELRTCVTNADCTSLAPSSREPLRWTGWLAPGFRPILDAVQ